MTHPLACELARRDFLRSSAGLLGALSLRSLATDEPARVPHFAPRAKSVIYLCLSGAPSQLDLYDEKPKLQAMDGQPMPASLVAGQAVDQLKGSQLVCAGSRFRFASHGRSGMRLSELLPHLGTQADRLALIRSMHTPIINHDPAMTMLMTGNGLPGRPSCGAWASYGLGSTNRDLPAFAVLTSGGGGLPARQWGAGFLPGEHQGVRLLSGAEPVRFLADPADTSRAGRRDQLDALRALDQQRHVVVGDPAIESRIAAYELAFRMQIEVPEVVDLASEGEHGRRLYGEDVDKPGSFARNCVLARRLVERGVRFVQLFDAGWDHHGQLVHNLRKKADSVDQAMAGLLQDLAARGLLDETLVVCAGEFGRTPMNQGGQAGDRYGRDHHGKAFSVWLAGAGIRGGTTLGATDELGYDIVERPVAIADLHATILQQLGFDHERLVHRHQGRDFRLTDVAGRVVREVLA